MRPFFHAYQRKVTMQNWIQIAPYQKRMRCRNRLFKNEKIYVTETQMLIVNISLWRHSNTSQITFISIYSMLMLVNVSFLSEIYVLQLTRFISSLCHVLTRLLSIGGWALFPKMLSTFARKIYFAKKEQIFWSSVNGSPNSDLYALYHTLPQYDTNYIFSKLEWLKVARHIGLTLICAKILYGQENSERYSLDGFYFKCHFMTYDVWWIWKSTFKRVDGV